MLHHSSMFYHVTLRHTCCNIQPMTILCAAQLRNNRRLGQVASQKSTAFFLIKFKNTNMYGDCAPTERYGLFWKLMLSLFIKFQSKNGRSLKLQLLVQFFELSDKYGRRLKLQHFFKFSE
jgi:hypothetical protein